MNYLLDTNILVYYITKPETLTEFEDNHQPFSNENIALISIVTVAEMRSIAIQRRWGYNRIKKLESLFAHFLKVPVQTEQQIRAYAEIDAYSKHKDPDRTYPAGYSSITMGKNDLWIAATTHIIGAKLVTADDDYDHLQSVFFDIIKVNVL